MGGWCIILGGFYIACVGGQLFQTAVHELHGLMGQSEVCRQAGYLIIQCFDRFVHIAQPGFQFGDTIQCVDQFRGVWGVTHSGLLTVLRGNCYHIDFLRDLGFHAGRLIAAMIQNIKQF